MWPQLQTVVQVAISHILNSLPEGLLIALFAAIMLRFLPRQNSGTRFAVWFMALLAVAALPFIGSTAAARSFASVGGMQPVISMSGRWALLLFLAWISALSIAMLRVANGLWRLRKLRTSCIAIDEGSLHPAVRETAAGFRASRSVKLATSERLNVPAAIGFFRPMIVIPSWALRELPPEELNIILLHEFAHLRRWDDWTNLLQKVVRSVFIFHPAVWWIENRLSLEREMACDDLVLAQTANPRGYAKCLITLLEKSFAHRGLAMAQAAVHRAREASLRLAQILDGSRSNSKRVWKPALACLGVFSVICLGTVARAPQLVAFEQSPQRIHSDSGSSVGSGQSQFRPAVIPAAWHTSSLPSVEKMPQSQVTHVKDVVRVHRHYVPRVAPALTSDAGTTQITAVRAEANPTAPPSETFLLIRTAQQTGPNSWTWSVSVWRVTWKNSTQDGTEKAPVAHKT